jgi:alpha-galactosidase
MPNVLVVGNTPASPWPRALALTPGLHGAHSNAIGPELSFGALLGDAYAADTVVLLKYAMGGRSLRRDFRPPSAGGTVGADYENMRSTVLTVLSGVSSSALPAFAGRPAVLEGLFWWQGWNDLDQPDGYNQLLAQLVTDLRHDLGKPALPVVRRRSAEPATCCRHEPCSLTNGRRLTVAGAGRRGNWQRTRL